MITKNKIKLIKSLHKKKYREQHQLFVVEGYKSIRELHNSDHSIQEIYVTESSVELDDLNPILISDLDMKGISSMTTPPGYLAVIKMPTHEVVPDTGMILALDRLQDPGNLGTIIRLADWFDIKHIVCDKATVDQYNPKCVQASMGSIARVHLHYMDLENYVSNSHLPIYTATMDGISVYENAVPSSAILIMGSESHGVRPSLLSHGKKIGIPQYGENTQYTESLNVASATAILLAQWRHATEM
jgi:TrmH family RNA methyltransferase